LRHTGAQPTCCTLHVLRRPQDALSGMHSAAGIHRLSKAVLRQRGDCNPHVPQVGTASGHMGDMPLRPLAVLSHACAMALES
jgi:hypothetical protein